MPVTTTDTSAKTARAKTTAKKTDIGAKDNTAAPSSDAVDMNASKEKECVDEKPLENDDEIEVVALIPNISYRDMATSDYYEWYEAGDVEYMTFDALSRMRRNNRGYFEDMCLKPNDDRVIKKFGLNKFYDKYDYFMNPSNYGKDNISNLLDKFGDIRSNSMKLSIINKIKDMVDSGDITNVNVIRTIEKRLDIDLIATL